MITTAFVGDLVVDLVKAGSESRRKRDFIPLVLGPTNPSTLLRSVSRLLKTGELEKVVKRGEPYLRITGLGKENFHRDFPLFKFQDQKWDGYWLVVSYDIPEKKRSLRESLSRRLPELGFGMWQRSVYISPHDFGEEVREWINSNRMEDFVSVSKSKELSEDEKELARKVFNLDELGERYLDILGEISELKGKEIPESIYNSYFQSLLCDPLLPRELLPKGWPGFKLRQVLVRGLPQ